MRDLLQGEALDAAVKPLTEKGWTLADDRTSLARSFRFRDFGEAFGWMTRVALAAEKLDHHPDWSNSYRTVEVRLSTHSAGGLTELDIALATKMNAFAEG